MSKFNDNDSAEGTEVVVPVRKPSKGIYMLPNMITLAALFAGFYAIVMAINGRFDLATVGIFSAMVLDSLDGRVDRLCLDPPGVGALGLDCRVCVLRLCSAAPGTLQCEHGGGRQAVFSGIAFACCGGFGHGLCLDHV